MLHRRQFLGVVSMALFIGACADETVLPTDQTELATVFDELATEATARGDRDEGGAFSEAALAIRLGIRPTEIGVTIGGEARRYLAFAHVVRNGDDTRPLPSIRSVVAYRRQSTGRRPAEVLYLATNQDSTLFRLPVLPKPTDGDFAVASWKDLINRQFWVATAGKGGIRLLRSGDPCPKVNSGRRVTCTVGEFGVLVDGEFNALIDNQRGNIDRSRTLKIGTRATGVNGAVLVFN